MIASGRPIVFVEIAGLKPIGTATAISVAASGRRSVSVAGTAQGVDAIGNNPDFIALVTNAPDAELFSAARKANAKAATILVTDLPMAEYTARMGSKDVSLLDHIIANTDPDWSALDLAVTLQKLIREDIFGIEKYLSSGTQILSHLIRGSRDRDPVNSAVRDWIESCGLRKDLARLAYGISEELLMNAIYDAPVAGGRTRYSQMDRRMERVLEEDEWSTLRCGYDGSLLAISIQDPFGAFPRDQWFKYLRKALVRNDPEKLIDTKKEGAGLGLFKVLYSSHGVVCNVAPKKMTEVASLIMAHKPQKDFDVFPRSIHFFSSDNA